MPSLIFLVTPKVPSAHDTSTKDVTGRILYGVEAGANKGGGAEDSATIEPLQTLVPKVFGGE